MRHKFSCEICFGVFFVFNCYCVLTVYFFGLFINLKHRTTTTTHIDRQSYDHQTVQPKIQQKK